MQTKNLFDICNPKQWKTLTTKDLHDSGYPVYGAGGIIGYWTDYNHEKETLIIGCRGSCGNLMITERQSYINGNAMALDDLNLSLVDIKYLYYYLSYRSLDDTITGGVQKQITRTSLKNVFVPLPTLETQNKIVEVLDKAQGLIDARKEQIRLIDELIQSVFYEMFSKHENYPTKSIDEVCRAIYDCPHSTPKYSSAKTSFRCLRTSNLGNGYIDWCNLAYVDEDIYHERNKRYTPNIGDVVYSREGAILGIAAIVNEEKFMCLGQRIMIFTLDNELVNSTFFWMILNSHFIRRQVELNIGGAAAPRINIKDIKKFEIFLPPIEFQNELAEKIDKIEEFKKRMTISEYDLRNTNNSLVQKIFKGELFGSE